MIIINVKLYVIYDNKDKILAITENELLLEYFILQADLYDNRIEKIKSEKKFNKLMVKYNDLLLEEVEGFAVREKETKYIEEIIQTTKYQIQYTMNCLKHINNDCIMSFEEHGILKDAISVLKKNTKNKNINEFINIRVFIRQLYNSSNMLQTLDELTRNFSNIITEDYYEE